jgi:transcriptional regulator with XRE-family HTH domain
VPVLHSDETHGRSPAVTEQPETSEAEGTADGEGADDDVSSTATRLRELGSYIRDQRNRAQYSLRHLARIAGVSNPYLSQIERGLRKPSAEILQAIAKALQISSETLYVKAGFLEDRDDLPDLEAAILREDSLTEPQRAALIEVYRSFRHENELAGAGTPPEEAEDEATPVLQTGSDDDPGEHGPAGHGEQDEVGARRATGRGR